MYHSQTRILLLFLLTVSGMTAHSGQHHRKEIDNTHTPPTDNKNKPIVGTHITQNGHQEADRTNSADTEVQFEEMLSAPNDNSSAIDQQIYSTAPLNDNQCPTSPEHATDSCPSPCPEPVIKLSCPEPRCPSLPSIPSCPTCTSTCPQPHVSLSCPQPVCPESRYSDAVTTPPNSLPPGYTAHFGVGAYKMHRENPQDWVSARDTCVDEGGHLVVPNSQEEADLLKKMISDNNLSWIHIGVHDLVIEGDYTTVLGQPLANSGYSNWSPDQPNGGREQNCCFMWFEGDLADGACSTKGAFVCELPFVPQTH